MGLMQGVWSAVKKCLTPISNLFPRPRLEVTYARLEEPFIVPVVDSKGRAAYYRIDITNNGNRVAKV